MASVQHCKSLLETALLGQGDTDIRCQRGQVCTFFDQFLGPLPLTDVLDLRHEQERLPRLVMRPGHAEQDPDELPVLAKEAFLHAVKWEGPGSTFDGRSPGRRPGRRGG